MNNAITAMWACWVVWTLSPNNDIKTVALVMFGVNALVYVLARYRRDHE